MLAMILVLGALGQKAFNSFGNLFGVGGHLGRRCSIVLASILVWGALGEKVLNSFGNYFGFGTLGGREGV